MEHDLIAAIGTTAAPAGQRRRAPAAAPSEFGAQIAAFYPYPQAQEPGNRAAGSDRSRDTAITPGTGIGRRRKARED